MLRNKNNSLFIEMPLLRKGHFYLGISGNAILSAEREE